MHRITFKFHGGEDIAIFGSDGENILSLARKANVAIDAPCSGNGSCGKCRVKLLEGAVGGGQTRHITAEETAEGWRLACASTVDGEAVLLIPDIASAYKGRLKVSDLSSQAEKAVFMLLQDRLCASGLKYGCGIKELVLKLERPALDDAMPDNERILREVAKALGVEGLPISGREQKINLSIPLPVLAKMPEVLRENNFEVRCIVDASRENAEILDILPLNSRAPVCGLAIDIGTTTVSCLLADLQNGEILAKANTGNGQIRYGADVINRIIEQQKQGGIERLQQAVVAETLDPLIGAVCEGAGISKENIYRMVVASNSTMNHLLLGINANHLRMEPYVPAFFELGRFNPAYIGIKLAPTAMMSVAPNIGSYVGGDITAGTLACTMWDSQELSVLIDLGTNGEIVFGNSDFLMACACSAGPAFEGGDISCGMRAADGAIEACTIDLETMAPAFEVIGGGKPIGLCGSGIIDVVAELFRTGIINGKGKFDREGVRVKRDEYGIGRYIIEFAENTETGRDISINEVDIGNFIRAKGAIFSAVMSLLAPLGFTTEDIENVMVAGGIGSGINIRNAICIGMLPDLPEEKYSYIGNSSLSGAYAMLVSTDAATEVLDIARSMTYIELSTQPGYMDEFIAACFIPHTDASLFPSVKT